MGVAKRFCPGPHGANLAVHRKHTNFRCDIQPWETEVYHGQRLQYALICSKVTGHLSNVKDIPDHRSSRPTHRQKVVDLQRPLSVQSTLFFLRKNDVSTARLGRNYNT